MTWGFGRHVAKKKKRLFKVVCSSLTYLNLGACQSISKPVCQSSCRTVLALSLSLASEFIRKDRAPVRLFALSNTVLPPNLLPLSAHSQQDEVSLRAVTDGERDGGGVCKRRSKYVNHLKLGGVFLKRTREKLTTRPPLFPSNKPRRSRLFLHVSWILITQDEFK